MKITNTRNLVVITKDLPKGPRSRLFPVKMSFKIDHRGIEFTKIPKIVEIDPSGVEYTKFTRTVLKTHVEAKIQDVLTDDDIKELNGWLIDRKVDKMYDEYIQRSVTLPKTIQKDNKVVIKPDSRKKKDFLVLYSKDASIHYLTENTVKKFFKENPLFYTETNNQSSEFIDLAKHSFTYKEIGKLYGLSTDVIRKSINENKEFELAFRDYIELQKTLYEDNIVKFHIDNNVLHHNDSVNEFYDLARYGFSYEEIAELYGVTHQKVMSYIKTHPWYNIEFMESVAANKIKPEGIV